MDSAKDLSLKNLLSSWRCEILYNLFKEEDIGIEDLKIMKSHHVCQLLKSYKMGVRIRFEHHLQKWHNQLGLALNSKDTKDFCNYQINSLNSFNGPHSCIWPEQNSCHHQNDMTLLNSNAINTDQPVKREQSGAWRSPQSPHDLSEIQARRDESPQSSHGLNENDGVNATPEPPIGDSNLVILRHYSIMDALPNACLDVNVTTPPEPSTGKRKESPFGLMQILINSGSKGRSLLQHYQQYKEFTKTERNILIHLICNFHIENKLHLSLTRSHEIEAEILELFPTEKVENYRTEKRGRIYIKYSNMKCYKSSKRRSAENDTNEEVPQKKSCELKTQEQIDDPSNSFDTWPEETHSNFIKVEEISCDDM